MHEFELLRNDPDKIQRLNLSSLEMIRIKYSGQ